MRERSLRRRAFRSRRLSLTADPGHTESFSSGAALTGTLTTPGARTDSATTAPVEKDVTPDCAPCCRAAVPSGKARRKGGAAPASAELPVGMRCAAASVLSEDRHAAAGALSFASSSCAGMHEAQTRDMPAAACVTAPVAVAAAVVAVCCTALLSCISFAQALMYLERVPLVMEASRLAKTSTISASAAPRLRIA